MNMQAILKRGRKGQGLVEYVLIIGLILFISIAVVGKLGKTIAGKFDTTNTEMSNQFTTDPTGGGSSGTGGTGGDPTTGGHY